MQDVQEKHQGCLCQLGDDARSARLCELNVIEQVAKDPGPQRSFEVPMAALADSGRRTSTP